MESIKNFYSRLFSLSRNYGFTMVEMTVALFILSLSIVFLVSLANNYLYILNSYRQRFIALSMAQEGIELAVALRNQQIEKGNVATWLGVTTSSNCLKFNTSTSNIELTPTSEPCEVFPGYKRLVKYSDFQNPGNPLNAATSVKIVSEVSFGKGNTTTLDLILIKWHPVFYEF
jgi:prepilin-type N-terminal cleavage/methylation domain-containing protein